MTFDWSKKLLKIGGTSDLKKEKNKLTSNQLDFPLEMYQ